MSTGVWVLLGIFAIAGLFAAWNATLRRSVRRRLESLGFRACDGETSGLTQAWQALVRSTGARRDMRLSSCLERASGSGRLHHVDVQDLTHRDDREDRVNVGANWSAYLFDLRDARSVHASSVVLYVAQSGSGLLRTWLRRLLDIDPPGAALEVGAHPWASRFVGAYGAHPGRLDELVPPAVQERLARAADHGFFVIHHALGKAAVSVRPGRRDVDREWAYLSEWV